MSAPSTSGCACGETAERLSASANRDQQRVLQLVLAINLALFVGEYAAGWWADSAALQADSLDSLGDAVAWLGQGWPDLLVGALVAVLFLHTSFGVLRTAIRQLRRGAPTAAAACSSSGT